MTTASMTTAPATRDRLRPGRVPRLLQGGGSTAYADHAATFGALPRTGPELIGEVTRSGLRGRGGAGFPTGRKLAAVARGRGPAVVVANGTEGEPLSAKDRMLLIRQPHLVIDGVLAAVTAVGADRAVICIERDRADAAAAVRRALAERPERLDLRVAMTPSRYVAGQETALVRWLDGGDARPVFRKPPFEHGVGGRPTLVDNVETLAHLALIARFGAEWYRSVGPADEPGSTLLTVGGAVGRPGVYEVPIGIPVADVLARSDAAPPRAVLFGGYFGTWVAAHRLAGLTVSRSGLAPVGATVGCGVLFVMPDDGCAVREVAAVSAWYAAQSAGQCGPCVFGLRDIASATRDLSDGAAGAGDVTRRWTGMVRRRGACQLPDGAAGFVDSALDAFAAEFAEHDHERGTCGRPYRGLLPAPMPAGGWR